MMKPTIHDRSTFEKGILWMLLSATFLSLSFVFLKINLIYLSYLFLLFLRFSIPLVFVLILLTLSGKWRVVPASKHIRLQLLRCFCVLISQYGMAYYITQNTLLSATVLLNTSPLFIPLIEWVFQGHRPGRSTVLGALLAFLGVILVLQPDSSLFSPLTAIGVIAALGQAGSQVLYGLKSKQENPLASLFYLFFFTTLISGLIFLWGEGSEGLRLYLNGTLSRERGWLISIYVILMGLTALLNQYYRGLAYKCGRPSTLATFIYFSVFVSAICDWLIFKNAPTLLMIIGSILIICGGIVKVMLRAKILKEKGKK